MKRNAILVFLLASLAFAAPQPAPLIGNIPNRTTISLNGEWRTIVDPYDIGQNSRFFLNAKPPDPRELVEYDFDTSPFLHVPGDWNSQRDDLFFYEGSVWYKKSFPYHKREHRRVFVYFGAAASRTTVYLNGPSLALMKAATRLSISRSRKRFVTGRTSWWSKSTTAAVPKPYPPSAPTGGTMAASRVMSCSSRCQKPSFRTILCSW